MKLYFGNGVTTATTILLFVLLGFLGDSIWHRENIVYWGRRTLFVLLRRSAGRTGQNHPARHRRQLRPWPVPAGQRAHADRLCGGGADPDRRHRHTHRQIPGAAGGLVLSRLCGRHAEDPDRRNLPAPHPLILTYASCASSHWGNWAMLSSTSSAPARKKTALAFSLAASRSAGGRASYSAWV